MGAAPAPTEAKELFVVDGRKPCGKIEIPLGYCHLDLFGKVV